MISQLTGNDKQEWTDKVVYTVKYNEQDATLYNILHYCQCSTCSRRFLRPSSGAQKLHTQHRVYAKLACCYLKEFTVETLWVTDDFGPV